MSLASSGRNTKSKTKHETVSFAHVLSYKLLNKHVEFLYPRLTSLEGTLKQAMLPVPFDVYVCTMVFVSMVTSVIGLIAGTVIAALVNIQPAGFAPVKLDVLKRMAQLEQLSDTDMVTQQRAVKDEGEITVLRFSPDGRTLISGGQGTVRIRRAATDEEVAAQRR